MSKWVQDGGKKGLEFVHPNGNKYKVINFWFKKSSDNIEILVLSENTTQKN